MLNIFLFAILLHYIVDYISDVGIINLYRTKTFLLEIFTPIMIELSIYYI